MKNKKTLFILLMLTSSAHSSDLLKVGVDYPYIATHLPSELRSAIPENNQIYSTNDFKMNKIKTVISTELISKRGHPDIRCKSKEMVNCILLFGATDGAVSFILNEGFKTFSVGIIYNQHGALTGEIIK